MQKQQEMDITIHLLTTLPFVYSVPGGGAHPTTGRRQYEPDGAPAFRTPCGGSVRAVPSSALCEAEAAHRRSNVSMPHGWELLPPLLHATSGRHFTTTPYSSLNYDRFPFRVNWGKYVFFIRGRAARFPRQDIRCSRGCQGSGKPGHSDRVQNQPRTRSPGLSRSRRRSADWNRSRTRSAGPGYRSQGVRKVGLSCPLLAPYWALFTMWVRISLVRL